MATHSNILAWRIPWTEETGRRQSMGSQRVGRDLVTKQQQSNRNRIQMPVASIYVLLFQPGFLFLRTNPGLTYGFLRF